MKGKYAILQREQMDRQNEDNSASSLLGPNLDETSIVCSWKQTGQCPEAHQ